MLDRLADMFGILRTRHEPEVPAMPDAIDDSELASIEGLRHG
jgi:hypothetical protein